MTRQIILYSTDPKNKEKLVVDIVLFYDKGSISLQSASSSKRNDTKTLEYLILFYIIYIKLYLKKYEILQLR
jgi:hypothetical protein